MPGGLHFGPPAWLPTQFENAPPPTLPQSPDHQITKSPNSRNDLIALLRQLELHNTSAITPGLLEQLERIKDRNLLTLILNLLPTQPEFALPAALSRISRSELLAGLTCIQSILQPRRTYIALDRHDLHLRRIWRHTPPPPDQKKTHKLTLRPLVNQYPIAHPTLLVRKLLGRRLPVGKLPTRLNCIILDPVTCWALGHHLLTGQPFNQRPVQLFVTSQKSSSARLVLAHLNETVEQLCRRYDILATTPTTQFILNGMLTGQQIDPRHTTITSSTESISIRDLPTPEPPTPCFACGWCVDVCPAELNPVNLLELSTHPHTPAQLRTPKAREALHCIDCGLCSYVCPTRLPLTQQINQLRHLIQHKE